MKHYFIKTASGIVKIPRRSVLGLAYWIVSRGYAGKALGALFLVLAVCAVAIDPAADMSGAAFLGLLAVPLIFNK